MVTQVNQSDCRSPRARGASGFTLIELLIVIAIIGILAGLAMTGISTVRERSNKSVTTSDISSLDQALQRYVLDEGVFPGQDAKKIGADDNQFPLLFNAIFGDPKPNGPGGRGAPYIELKEDKVRVWDEAEDAYRPATRSELFEPRVKKYMVDAWGTPLVYRSNKGRRPRPYMHKRRGADLYSLGPDATDQTKTGSDDENDDIGNW